MHTYPPAGINRCHAICWQDFATALCGENRARELRQLLRVSMHADTHKLLDGIKETLESSGLGDLKSSMIVDGGSLDRNLIVAKIRPEYKKEVKQLILPCFATNISKKTVLVDLARDVEQYIDWQAGDFEELFSLVLADKVSQERVVHDFDTIPGAVETTVGSVLGQSGLELRDIALALLDDVHSPFKAFDLAGAIFTKLQKVYSVTQLRANGGLVIAELRRLAKNIRNQKAEQIFRDSLEAGKIEFINLSGLGWRFPESQPVDVSSGQHYTQLSLFDIVGNAEMNAEEKNVARFLESQRDLYFWYRNSVFGDSYSIQGWQRGKVWPDFVWSSSASLPKKTDNIFVTETKGEHLVGSEDLEYKKALLDLCDHLAKKLGQKQKLYYKWVPFAEYQQYFMEMLAGARGRR